MFADSTKRDAPPSELAAIRNQSSARRSFYAPFEKAPFPNGHIPSRPHMLELESEVDLFEQPHADDGATPCASNDFSRVPVTLRNRSGSGPSLSEFAQAKLVVGSTDDPLEHQADRVADQVMRIAEPMTAAAGSRLGRQCDVCRQQERSGTLRAKQQHVRGSPGVEELGPVQEVLRSAGAPLDASTRAFFEPRFGRDFSQVRVHVGDRAARSARAIGARAYTVGGHIAFAEGQYEPSSECGRHLLAHELTHTVQQGASGVRRSTSSCQQATTGLVHRPEEISRYEEESNPIERRIQRAAIWKGAVVHETLNDADIIAGTQPDPITWHLLNGTKLATDAAADGAIKVPRVTTLALPSTDPAATWNAKIDTVPRQEGSADETVLAPGPWTKVVTKAAARGITGLAACTGAGNSTFRARGRPSDDAVYRANRRHEDHHVADHKAAFDDAIGEWDKKVQEAKRNGTAFTGSSAADATAKLWVAMGNTPQEAARSYRAQGFAKGGAFHATARGGPMSISNPVSNANCTTCRVDVTNPS